VGGRGPHLPEPASPTWVVAAWPLAADLGDRHRRGARIATVATRRLHPATLPPSAKLGNYLNSVLAAAEASERGSDEAVMLTTSGLLAEGAGANLFMVVGDGGLRTPGLHLGVLPGITRGIVLGLARDAGLAAEEGEYPAGALESAAEIFLTNSVLGIWPVCDADGRSRPCPGPVTRVLMEAYRAAVRRATGGDHPVPPIA
jgi:branched-subunit amino acid aminotransferase/4-amino-4-deoxychorismate lyase